MKHEILKAILLNEKVLGKQDSYIPCTKQAVTVNGCSNVTVKRQNSK